jgi:hypothetical protein
MNRRIFLGTLGPSLLAAAIAAAALQAGRVDSHELLRQPYAAFNARDIDAALAAMHRDVEWPNGRFTRWSPISRA